MNNSEIAIEKRKKGYNCCQAVVCTYNDKFDLTEEQAYKIAEGMGSGIGGTFGICGAVTAMVLILGLDKSDFEKIGSTKAITYQYVRKLISEFEEKNKSSICRELKGIDNKVVLRSCEGCIIDACDILDRYFKEKEL